MARQAASASGLSVLGVRIRIDLSWVLFAVFIAWSLASGALPMLYTGLPPGTYWGVAIIVVLGIAVSIVLHELAHTLVGRLMGVSIQRITLFLFGGVAELEEEPKRPAAELAMAVAGPALSIVLGLALAFAAGAVRASGGPVEAVIALGYLGQLNLVLAVFNMVPAFPLDGGRVLRAILWGAFHDLAKATRIASRTGEVLAILLMAAGFAALFVGGIAAGLWWVLLGLFLHSAARRARVDQETRQQFAGHSVGELMTTHVETAPAALTVDRFVGEQLMDSRHGLYPVEQRGQWLGVVSAEDILRIPHDAWPRTTLEQVCRPASATPTAEVSENPVEVMARMNRLQVQSMPVLRSGALVGIVTLQDLLRGLELWRRFPRQGAIQAAGAH